MKSRVRAAGVRDFSQALAESYAVNDRMSLIVLEPLNPIAWRAQLPGGRGRTIAAMAAYMIAHNAHPRGQACQLARQLRFPPPQKGTSPMWAWKKLWKDCGFTGPW